MAFTEADQKKLDDLTYRKAAAEWATREDTRKATLEAVGGLGKVFTKDAVQPFVDAATAARPLLAASNPTIADMLGNIVTVMGFSGMQVAQFVEQLNVAEPEPAAPADAATTSSE